MTKSELYFEYLAEEGFRPKIDEGDIVFKKEGRTYVLFVDDNDEHLFRLGALFLRRIESEDERIQALQVASDVTGLFKVTKVYVANDHVHATAELLFSNPEDFKPLFYRVLGLIDAGTDKFAEGMAAFENADDENEDEDEIEEPILPKALA